jgi:hypothetical protein
MEWEKSRLHSTKKPMLKRQRTLLSRSKQFSCSGNPARALSGGGGVATTEEVRKVHRKQIFFRP